MSVPRLAYNNGIYHLDWLDELLSIRIDRLIEDSKYNVTAELNITSRAPGIAPHIHQARLNLTSTTTRGTLARHLLGRMPEVNWHTIIEQACVLVLDKHRQGSPVITLADHELTEGLKFRLHPLVQERQATLLFGDGGTGKSWFAIYIATLVTTGMSINGFNAEPGSVLYLDYETDEDTLRDRVDQITRGLGVDIPGNFYYRHCHQALSADIEQINRIVLEKDISLVIIDSAAPAVGEPESAQMTAEYFRALRSLRVSTTTVAHVAKGGKENEPFGSIFWRNLPRANFRVNASHEPGDTSFVIGLKHTKSNNGQRLRDMAFEINFGDGGVTFNPARITDHPELARGLSLGQRISAALQHGGLTVKELAENLDETEANVRTTLNRGKGEQFAQVATNLGNPKWGNLVREV